MADTSVDHLARATRQEVRAERYKKAAKQSNDRYKRKIEMVKELNTQLEVQVEVIAELRDKVLELEKAAGKDDIIVGLRKKLRKAVATIEVFKKSVRKKDDTITVLKHDIRAKSTTIMSLDANHAGITGHYEKFDRETAGLTPEAKVEAAVSRFERAERSFQYETAFAKLKEDNLAREQAYNKSLEREIKSLRAQLKTASE